MKNIKQVCSDLEERHRKEFGDTLDYQLVRSTVVDLLDESRKKLVKAYFNDWAPHELILLFKFASAKVGNFAEPIDPPIPAAVPEPEPKKRGRPKKSK